MLTETRSSVAWPARSRAHEDQRRPLFGAQGGHGPQRRAAREAQHQRRQLHRRRIARAQRQLHFVAGGLVGMGQLQVPAVVAATGAPAQRDAVAGEPQVGGVVVGGREAQGGLPMNLADAVARAAQRWEAESGGHVQLALDLPVHAGFGHAWTVPQPAGSSHLGPRRRAGVSPAPDRCGTMLACRRPVRPVNRRRSYHSGNDEGSR
jgi:hypothetical protein